MNFNYFQELINRKLKLPYELVANMGLHNASEQHITLRVPKKVQNYCELIISPIPLAKRKDLWHFTVSFFDRRGLLSELNLFFKRNNIDILDSRASISENNKFLNVAMVLDTQGYISSYGKINGPTKSSAIQINTLKALVAARFIQDVVFHYASNSPILEIAPNYALNRSRKNSTQHDIVNINKSEVSIPSDIYSQVKQNLEDYRRNFLTNNEVDGEGGTMIASIVSSLNWHYLKIFLFYADTGIIHIRVKGRNTVGALAAVTKIINQKNFNIIQLFSRDIHGKSIAINDFMLDIEASKARKLDDKYLKNFIKESIEHSEISSEYNWEVSFPRKLRRMNLEHYG
ncbi:MAG: hypothetical protein AAF927_27080 [Bacteroidota bacterium]